MSNYTWKYTGEVTVDSPGREPNQHSARIEWRTRTQNADDSQVLRFFYHFFPMDAVADVVKFTNIALERANQRRMTQIEFFIYVGVTIAMARCGMTSTAKLFSKPNDMFDARPYFSPFMSHTRYVQLSRWLVFADMSMPPDEPALHKFWEVQPLIDAFNKRRRTGFTPGHKLCVDESRFRWYGKDQDYAQGGAPFISKQKSKPDNLAMEVKNIADVETGIMLRIEPVSHQGEMATRKYTTGLNAGTAYILRLAEDFQGTNRTILADSYFSSVQAALELKKRGLNLIGSVKRAHKQFPKQYLSAYPLAEKGDHHVLTSTDGLRAVVWKDRNRFFFVSTCETTIAGPVQKKRRWVNHANGTTTTFYKDRNRPKIVSEYHDGSQAIDVHNHLRANIGLVRRTKRWQLRYFHGILGMCVVDAFLAMRATPPCPFEHLTEFTEELCRRLLHTHAQESQESPAFSYHVQRGLSQSRYYKSMKALNPSYQCQLRCRECGHKCQAFCKTCSPSDTTAKGIVALCSPLQGQNCFQRHVEAVRSGKVSGTKRKRTKNR